MKNSNSKIDVKSIIDFGRDVVKKSLSTIKSSKGKLLSTLGAVSFGAAVIAQCPTELQNQVVPLSDSITLIVPGVAGSDQAVINFYDNSDGNDNCELKLNGVQVPYGVYSIKGQDHIVAKGMISGTDGLDVFAGSDQCTEGQFDDIEVSQALAIKITKFEGETSNGVDHVTLGIASQDNTAEIELLMSYTGRVEDAEVVETVAGDGTTNEYKEIEFKNRNFNEYEASRTYFVRETEASTGKVNDYKDKVILTSEVTPENYEGLLYPNPVMDKEIAYSLIDADDRIDFVHLVDITGKVHEVTYDIVGNQVIIQNDFPAGMYNLNVILNNGRHINKQFVK